MEKIICFAKKHKIKFILIICLSILICAMTMTTVIKRNNESNKLQEYPELEWKTYEVKNASNVSGKALIIFRNEIGYKEVHYPAMDGQDEFIVYPDGKTIMSFDYEMEDLKTYQFNVILNDNTTKTYTINYEVPRIKGNYALHNGLYVCEPDISKGIIKDKTRYLYLNNVGNLVPGNWLTEEEPDSWYDYANQNWANIYVENNGIENYFVWIPRYCYKVDNVNSVSGNERMDVKFINVYNEYISADGTKTSWDVLKAQGYEIPEAFTWYYQDENVDIEIPGYWEGKYQISTVEAYKLNYNLTASSSKFNVSNFVNNVSSDAISYTYAINGNIVETKSALENFDFVNSDPDNANVINITALNANGEIVGSMTKELELVEVNAPDLTGLDPDTTFYVYWDEDGNEHNEIPISMDPPSNWYNYSYSSWANIVTRNNEMETYFVWIPRYQYLLDQTSQRANIKFIQGIETEVSVGYEIPEAFTWINEAGESVELAGYWETKYQLSEKTVPKIFADVSISSSAIKVRDIQGSALKTTDENGNEVDVNINYEYYINGNKVHTGTNPLENYVYRELQDDTIYTVNIIARNTVTNEFIGAITKKVKTRWRKCSSISWTK